MQARFQTISCFVYWLNVNELTISNLQFGEDTSINKGNITSMGKSLPRNKNTSKNSYELTKVFLKSYAKNCISLLH